MSHMTHQTLKSAAAVLGGSGSTGLDAILIVRFIAEIRGNVEWEIEEQDNNL